MHYDTLSELRILIRREIDKLVEFRIYASYRIPLTLKTGLRMGTGKGKISEWLTEYKRGQLLLSFEDCGGKLVTSRVFRLLHHKLPVKIKIFRR